jgi:glycosyltransferase involved in cell wall biosynthesis
MRIGIDARRIRPLRTGTGNFVYGLVERLPDVAPEHDYFLYSHKEIGGAVPTAFHKCVDYGFSWCPGSFWLLARGGHFARIDRLDVFWSTSALLPQWVSKNVLKVITVYDLVWRHFPETVANYNLLVHRMLAGNAISKCDRIITISQSVRDDLTYSLRVPHERVKIVYPGVFEEYKLQDRLAAAGYISRKYGVAPCYMAAVGTVEPRKNLGLLVRALKILQQDARLDCPLVIAGANGWKNTQLFQEIRDSGLTEQEIRFLGYLPSEDLPRFYAGAQVFLFPSLYEGFGMPPLEAMACGTPVIASNAPPMPEVLGDAAILEPPSSADRFAEAISRVLTDENLRCTMRTRGLERAQKFRWEASVRQLLEALN